jgi:hypothetical protein
LFAVGETGPRATENSGIRVTGKNFIDMSAFNFRFATICFGLATSLLELIPTHIAQRRGVVFLPFLGGPEGGR